MMRRLISHISVNVMFCLSPLIVFQKKMVNIKIQWLGYNLSDKNSTSQNKGMKKQEAYGPRLDHLSDIATADMLMLYNIFSNPIIATNEIIII